MQPRDKEKLDSLYKQLDEHFVHVLSQVHTNLSKVKNKSKTFSNILQQVKE